MAKKRRRKRRYTRLIDLILNLFLLACIVLLLHRCYALAILPWKYLLAITALLFFIFAIFFILMLMRLSKGLIIFKRLCLFVFCGLFLFGTYSLHNVNKAVQQISISETSPTIKSYLIVAKDSSISSLSQCQQATLGIQQGSDKENTDFILNQIKKDNITLTDYEVGKDYKVLATLFLNRMIDGFFVSDPYLKMLEANQEGFKDSYKIIETFQRERPINASDSKNIAEESFTLLISGVDEIGIADQSSLSDVNILLFINPKSNQITMLSLPRDSLMPHAFLQNVNDKLTHTGPYGIQDTVATIENFLEIDIDYYAKVSFSSLIEIVDQIGGIQVDVEIAFTEQDENRSFAQEDLIHLEKGLQQLNGKQALAYARHRKSANYDIAGRERAQERIIKAIIDKLVSFEGMKYVNQLLQIVPSYVVTNMPAHQITSFIKGELNQLSPWSIRSITLDHGMYDTRMVPNLAVPQDVYLWDKYDYRIVKDAYESSKDYLPLHKFQFDLADMTLFLPEVNTNPNIVWDYMAIDPH